MEEKSNKRKMMAFDISYELHRQIKILAARRGISMALWMQRAIYDRLKRELQIDAEINTSGKIRGGE
jgi:predicted HicB family RNase H-like nuclease